MPYITTEEVKEIRQKLKKEFPNFKFSIRKSESSSGVDVTILTAPIQMLINEDDIQRGYRQVNHFWINETYEEYPEVREILNKIKGIMNKKNGVLVEDSDYGTVPYYYTNIYIGDYNKPFVVK